MMKRRTGLSPLLGAILLAALYAAAKDVSPAAGDSKLGKATFAGGCFWCMEEVFEGVEGVVSATSGYMGGHQRNPSYEEVSAGGTGHAESVEVIYDPAKVTYSKLLEFYWRNIDPTDPRGQFCDKGTQYRSAIFYHDETQKRLAEESEKAVGKSKPFRGPLLTEIVPASQFYPAEEYHQNFSQKNPLRYKLYKYNCGRAQRLQELWRTSKG